MLSICIINLAMDLSSYGQNPNKHSYNTTPNDQTSAFELYEHPFKTSGAMYIGDPTIVYVRSLLFSNDLQKPKSATLTI